MTIDTDKLRVQCQQLIGWSNCNLSWVQDDGVAIVGYIDHEAGEFELLRIDTAEYDQPDDAIKLAEFYATVNPAAILALLDELDRLRACMPDGWQLVPKRVTMEQRKAGMIGIERAGKFIAELTETEVGLVYHYVLAASPKPEHSQCLDRVKAAHLAGYRLAQEQAAKECEETDVEQFTHCQVLHDDGPVTLANAAEAIRALQPPAEWGE